MSHYELQNSFDAFLNLLRTNLHPQLPSKNTARLGVVRNKTLELRRLVDELEAGPEFVELINHSMNLSFTDSPTHSIDSRAAEIGNFFRRSRCYLRIFKGEPLDGAALFEKFVFQFSRKQINRRYFLPLRSFGFSEERIKFQGFLIQRLSTEELDELCENDVREIFYEWSSIDLSEIRGYWFINVPLSEPPTKFGTSPNWPADPHFVPGRL
jgi:hypothetical protein